MLRSFSKTSCLVSHWLALSLLGLLSSVSCQQETSSQDPGAEYRRKVEEIDQATGARVVGVEELKELLLNEESLVILDTREPEEYSVSHLPNARLVPPAEVDSLQLDSPEGTTVVTYCTVGYRSGQAAVRLSRRLGRPVYSLEGGIIAWYNAQGPLVDRDGSPIRAVHSYSEDWQQYLE